MPNPTIRSTSDDSGNLPLTISLPAGASEGDLLLIFVVNDNSSGETASPPSGWIAEPFDAVQDGAGKTSLAMFYKTAGPSEPSSYTIGSAGGTHPEAVASAVAVIGGSTPESSATASSTSNVPAAPSIGMFGSDRLVLAAWGCAPNDTVSPPGSMTNVDGGASSSAVSLRVGGQDFTSSGSTGTFTPSQPVGVTGATAIDVSVPPATASSLNNNCTLFVGGYDVDTDNCTLFVGGEAQNNQCDLFVGGVDAATPTSLTLFMTGETNEGSVTLFTWGDESLSSSADLALPNAAWPFESMGLVVAAEPVPVGVPTLFVAGSSGPGAALRTTLFTASGPITAAAQAVLSILGASSDVRASSLVLSVNGVAGSLSGSSTLLACNTQEGSLGTTPLFLKVGGTLLGGQAASEGVDLFLKRPAEWAVNLSLRGPGDAASGSPPLFVTGCYAGSGSVPLCVPVTKGVLSPFSKLFTQGW